MITVPISINDKVVDKVQPKDMNQLNKGFEAKNLCIDDIVNHILQGHAISPAWMEVDDDGCSIRKNAAFKQAQLIFLDIDNSIVDANKVKRRKTDEEGYLPWEKVVNDKALRQKAFMIYTTASHTEEWNRFRIVYCLKKPITDVGKYRDIVRGFVEYTKADEACKAPVNVFYGNTNAEIHPFGCEIDNETVDYIVTFNTEVKRESRQFRTYVKEGVLTEDHVREILRHIPVEPGYDIWTNIIGGVSSFFDEETTVRLIEEWSPGDGKPPVRKKVRHRKTMFDIGYVIRVARKYGYLPPRGLYSEGKYTEDAGLVVKGLSYPMSHTGNGERFVAEHRDKVRYCATRKMWYIWDGKRLKPDNTGLIYSLAKKTYRDIANEIADIDDTTDVKKALAWIKESESMGCVEASIKAASREQEIVVTADQLDANPLELNLNNVIMDLNTLTPSDHDIDRYHTRVVPINYVENATCPKWEAFLEKIFDGDKELIFFMQQAVGYTLSGLVSAEALFFCYGSGANGKSVFFSVIDMLLGGSEGYSFKAKSDLVMMRKGDPGVAMDIAELSGKRFVYTDELPDNKRFDANKIKDITSHDTLNGRFIYEKSFTFQPTHKLWMFGNVKPRLTEMTDGIWRRLFLIPFTVTIPEGERRAPEELKAEFRQEISGILNWALIGFHRWKHEGGFRVPECVRKETGEYRSQMDIVGAFLLQETVEQQGASLPHKVLFQRYQAWCQEQGIDWGMTSVGLSMHLHEIKKLPSRLDRNKTRVWIGLQLAVHIEESMF